MRQLRGGWLVGLGAILGGGALVLTVAGLLARRVPPTSVWWLQPVALLLPLAATATALAAVGWSVAAMRTGRGMLWIVASAHLLAAGVALWRLFGVPAATPDDEATAFRVMSLNAAWSRRGDAEEIGTRFAEAEPHVVALQEVSVRPGPSDGTWIAEGAPLALLTNPTYDITALDRPAGSAKWMTNGTALFTRLDAGRSDPILLDTLSATNSGKYTRTEVAWQGQPIAIYNVHFRSFTAPRPWGAGVRGWIDAVRASSRDFIAREAEARTFRRALDAETLPFIVAGDFNATPDHWTYAHVADDLVDALRSASGLAATYPDARPLVRIDAILASPHWTVRHASVQPPGISDHRLILADLVLTPEETGS